MKQFYSNQKAFTLIEVLVAIAIIAIIAAISFQNLGKAKNASNVDNACNQVASLINKTKNYALSGKSSGSESGLSAYVITIQGHMVTIQLGVLEDPETTYLPKGVYCDPRSLAYLIPSGSLRSYGNTNIEINCSDGEASRKVIVGPISASCP